MQVAVITGGSSGIGRGAALEIARRGVAVVVTYRGSRERALETVERIEKDGGTAAELPLDVVRPDRFTAFRDALTEVLRGWDRTTFDALVNNAGIGQPVVKFEDTSPEHFDQMVNVHFRGPYFLTQTLLPLIADHGSIVFTTSTSALESARPTPGYSVYASVKGAQIVLTRYLAKELSVRGIRVNAVAPGTTRTRLGDDTFSKHPELIAPIAARTALGRIGEAEDLGKVIAFLASDDAGWITAQTVEASGGYEL